jgi:hypothetical protein
MDKIIKNSERFELSGADIMRITDDKTRIIQYEELETTSNLEQLLNPFGSVIILYTTKKNFGHWVALFRKKNNVKKDLEFFDPYGLSIDEELNINNELHLRQHNGRITPHLSALISKGDYNVSSNKTQLQKFLEDVETCGRFVALRVRFRNLTLKKYSELLTTNKHYDADFWVSALTLLV